MDGWVKNLGFPAQHSALHKSALVFVLLTAYHVITSLVDVPKASFLT